MLASIPTVAVFPEEGLTLDQRIEKWVWQLCRSLEENYNLRYPNSPNPIKFNMEFGRKCTDDGHWSFVWIHDKDVPLSASKEKFND